MSTFRIVLADESAVNGSQLTRIRRQLYTWLRQGVLAPTDTPGIYMVLKAPPQPRKTVKRAGWRAWAKPRTYPKHSYRTCLALADVHLHGAQCWCLACNPAPKRRAA